MVEYIQASGLLPRTLAGSPATKWDPKYAGTRLEPPSLWAREALTIASFVFNCIVSWFALGQAWTKAILLFHNPHMKHSCRNKHMNEWLARLKFLQTHYVYRMYVSNEYCYIYISYCLYAHILLTNPYTVYSSVLETSRGVPLSSKATFSQLLNYKYPPGNDHMSHLGKRKNIFKSAGWEGIC